MGVSGASWLEIGLALVSRALHFLVVVTVVTITMVRGGGESSYLASPYFHFEYFYRFLF